jgi:hypothetical protein
MRICDMVTIQRYRDTEIQSYRATELQSYRATELQSYRATEERRDDEILLYSIAYNFSTINESSIPSKPKQE